MRILYIAIAFTCLCNFYAYASHDTGTEETETSPKAPARKKSILLVDDNEVKLLVAERAICQALSKAGVECSIDKANGPDQAKELAVKNPYDVYVLDHDMPGQTGPELVVELRKLSDPGESSKPDPLFVLNTANTEAQELYRSTGEGPEQSLFDAVPSGLKPSDLATAVKELVLKPSRKQMNGE